MASHQTPQNVLRTVFGYPHFRQAQAEVIQRVLTGKDALVLMPTGGGKSLCYQIPALLLPGVAVVISPLIALMQDQVTALQQLGVQAATLNSSLDFEQSQIASRQLRQGTLDLLYISPEKLMTPRFLELLQTIPIALFAIDEVHCVSKWGHDFRPEYLQLSILAERFPQIPRLALTATADVQTRRDIISQLRLEQAQIFITGFNRPNIRYQVVQKQKGREQLLSFLREAEYHREAGIIYCLSRKKVDSTARWLTDQGWLALPYHAGLDSQTRRYHQHRFLREEGLIMVATIAFGMGIDKPNVRFVAHLDLPKSLEAYYQETGRAGRDGLPATAWMIYGLQDVILLRQLLNQSEADAQHKRIEQHKLEALLGYCETTTCRRQTLLAYFGETSATQCGNCDTCLIPVATWEGTEIAQKALSCIYRTGQRFGVYHLVDVLLGKTNDRITKFKHQRVSTFGIGQELEAKQWYSIYRQLIARGLVTVDMEGYGGLQLAEQALPVLRGEEQVAFRKEVIPASPNRYRRPKPESSVGVDQTLWEALRAKRLELAQTQNVPPYVIFHDSTLREMLHRQPDSLEALAEISGVGRHKLARYGQIFLKVLDTHRQKSVT